MTFDLQAFINQRQRQILLHSYLYYELNESLISDEQFDKWCNEYIFTAQDNPDLVKTSVYGHLFHDFTHASGFNLEYRQLAIEHRANQLLYYIKNKEQKE